MSKKLTYMLSALALVWATSACNNTSTDNKKTEEEQVQKDKKPTKNALVPSTLENFDNTYHGTFKGQRTQLNLRRYGSAMSGNWWMGEATEVSLEGSLRGEENDFDLEVMNTKGDKIGHLVGKMQNGNLRTMFKTPKDSTAIEFFALARNAQILRVESKEMKSSKASQSGKRQITITYPQILGISDEILSKRVNSFLDHYFNDNTWTDSLERGSNDFHEDVRMADVFLSREYVSVCKNHHIDRNDGTHIFDDSHGLTIDFKRAKVYELRDLFKPNAIDALNKMVLGRINKSCSGGLSDDMLDKCKMKGEERTSFSLHKNKITFHLTERLPEASRGCGYVRIEYKDLLDFINPSGPLAEHLRKK